VSLCVLLSEPWTPWSWIEIFSATLLSVAAFLQAREYEPWLATSFRRLFTLLGHC
jgi:hypothetical protein